MPWTGKNGNLCEYCRPFKRVTTKWRHPSGTGFEYGLYTSPGLPPDEAEYIEKYFMGLTDSSASKAQQVLLSWGKLGVQTITIEERIGWARFLYALSVRTPEQIANLTKKYVAMLPGMVENYRDVYSAKRRASDPADFDDFKSRYLANPKNQSPLHAFPGMLNSELVLPAIAQMTFRTLHITQFAGPTFLTSDRPFIMTDGIGRPGAHIVIPISPTILFLAENGDNVYRHMMSLSAKALARTVNEKVTEQAHRYVYGVNPSQQAFVENRLGKKAVASPLG